MTATIEERVTVLEGKVEYLEANAGPGQAQAFSASLAEFRQEVSVRLRRLEGDVGTLKIKFDRMQADVTGLKIDVSTLKTDVSTLKTDVSTLKTDVSTLKTDVSTLKTDVSTLKTKVDTMHADMVAIKGTLAEILDRMPPKTA